MDKPIRINLVESEAWKRYDPGGDIMNWASDNAWDDWHHMDDSTCEGLVDDLIGASLTKRDQKKVQEGDLERICQEMKERGNDEFEAIQQAIIDASQWAWEIAYTPEDRDIRDAMDRAWDDLDLEPEDYWDRVLEHEGPVGPREWSPKTRWSYKRFFEALKNGIHYERKPNYYDRFIVFDWFSIPVVEKMLRELNLEEDPEVTGDDVRNDLKRWAEAFMHEMKGAIEKEMEHSDPGNRVEFQPMWKQMLKDKQVLGAARKEILDFLAKPRKEEVE